MVINRQGKKTNRLINDMLTFFRLDKHRAYYTQDMVDLSNIWQHPYVMIHVGFTPFQVSFKKTKFDIDDGLTLYEIEFDFNQIEYEYEIDAKTGAILDYEIENDCYRNHIETVQAVT